MQDRHRRADRASRAAALPRLPLDSLGFAFLTAGPVIGAMRAGAALPAALSAAAAKIEAAPPTSPSTSSATETTAATSDASFSAPAATGRAGWHGAVQDIAYRTVRALGLVDALIARLVPKAPAPPVRDLLAVALALLTAEDLPYATHTVVDQAVRAAAASSQTAFARGLVNAVLRAFLREAAALTDSVRQSPVARWNYPQWWIDAVAQAHPAAWQAILDAGNTHPPLTLRVNARHSTPAAYLTALAQAQIDAVPAGEAGVRLLRPVAVDRLPGFAEGHASVQDTGAQRAALLLGVADGMRVLDACAAPGGKTGHLLELADIDLVALESDAQRAVRIHDNLRRLQRPARVVVGDAAHPVAPWWDDKPFDRILADVPCSASGIVRRHPDIRWLRRAEDIGALVKTQRQILRSLWQTLAPGGILLYVTCSIFPEEGEEQAAWFGDVQQDAVRLDAPGQLIPTAASGAAGLDHDGFFYARFQKR